MIGEQTRHQLTVHVPPWDVVDDRRALFPAGSPYPANPSSPVVADCSPFLVADAFTALNRYLPSNECGEDKDPNEVDSPIDAFSCDNFRMFDFKVRKCCRGRSHDWTECPYAHPGEKARRRDPRKYHYSGTACPEFRKGSCRKGDSCEFAHGVFECWLHPARYRTQPCKDGTQCRRRVCFFAHTPGQLRVLSQQSPRDPADRPQFDSYDGSPLRQVLDSCFGNASFVCSPNSTLISPPVSPPSVSPPLSPLGCAFGGLSTPSESTADLTTALRNLQIEKVKFCSSNSVINPRSSVLRRGFFSSPTRRETGRLDLWELSSEEEPAMERVESGRNLRAKIYEKLTRENSLGRAETGFSGPDVGWVSELLQ